MSIDFMKFGEQMAKILDKYSDDVIEATSRLVKKAGNQAKERLKIVSPRRYGGYAEGWKTTEYKKSALGASVVVYNSKKPGLAHLLENGHAKQNGGRVPAIIHIAPVEKTVNEELEKDIIKAIENAGA